MTREQDHANSWSACADYYIHDFWVTLDGVARRLRCRMRFDKDAGIMEFIDENGGVSCRVGVDRGTTPGTTYTMSVTGVGTLERVGRFFRTALQFAKPGTLTLRFLERGEVCHGR